MRNYYLLFNTFSIYIFFQIPKQLAESLISKKASNRKILFLQMPFEKNSYFDNSYMSSHVTNVNKGGNGIKIEFGPIT